MYMEYKKIG